MSRIKVMSTAFTPGGSSKRVFAIEKLWALGLPAQTVLNRHRAIPPPGPGSDGIRRRTPTSTTVTHGDLYRWRTAQFRLRALQVSGTLAPIHTEYSIVYLDPESCLRFPGTTFISFTAFLWCHCKVIERSVSYIKFLTHADPPLTIQPFARFVKFTAFTGAGVRSSTVSCSFYDLHSFRNTNESIVE